MVVADGFWLWYKGCLFELRKNHLQVSEFRKGWMCIMSKVCVVTGKKPMVGNNVSHANNKTKRRFVPNLQERRFWVESQKRFIKMRVSTKGIRIIDKLGIEAVLEKIAKKAAKIAKI